MIGSPVVQAQCDACERTEMVPLAPSVTQYADTWSSGDVSNVLFSMGWESEDGELYCPECCGNSKK